MLSIKNPKSSFHFFKPSHIKPRSVTYLSGLPSTPKQQTRKFVFDPISVGGFLGNTISWGYLGYKLYCHKRSQNYRLHLKNNAQPLFDNQSKGRLITDLIGKTLYTDTPARGLILLHELTIFAERRPQLALLSTVFAILVAQGKINTYLTKKENEHLLFAGETHVNGWCMYVKDGKENHIVLREDASAQCFYHEIAHAVGIELGLHAKLISKSTPVALINKYSSYQFSFSPKEMDELSKAYQADLNLFEKRSRSEMSHIQFLHNDYQANFFKMFISQYASFKQLNEIPSRYVELLTDEYGINISFYLPHMTTWMNKTFFKKCEEFVLQHLNVLEDEKAELIVENQYRR